jgi:DNA-binding LacI/PurR family transcriptional regulator
MNEPARRLSLQQSGAIALVTYAYSSKSAVPDTFMLELMSGISSGLRADGYDLLVIHVDPDDIDWAQRYLETGRADGFILLSATCTERQLDKLVELKAPFITWAIPPGEHRGCSVSGDSFTGGKLATEHLLSRGREHIAFLGGPLKEREVADRYRGYEAALREAGMTVDPRLVVHGDWEHPDTAGSALMAELLEREPELDAVFANSDLLAIGAMDTLREQGRDVPDDVSVVGYDDISLARHTDPALTTIRQNGPLAGTLLAQNLVQHLQTGVITHVSIPAELVVRGST